MKNIRAILANPKLLIKIGITLLILFLFRILTWVPIPLLETKQLQSFIANSPFLAILNNFSGNALGRFSIMAMGISPYITASIVVQLLQMDLIPILKEWGEQGEAGKKKTKSFNKNIRFSFIFYSRISFNLRIICWW